jgi:FixJ family two-component response regulator
VALLVTDVNLPAMTGPELADVAQARHPELRVVLMSGAGRGFLVQQGLVAPEAVLLVKPFLAAELREAVSRALRDLPRRSSGSASGTIPVVRPTRAVGDDD